MASSMMLDDDIELERKTMQATVDALKSELVDRNAALDGTQHKLEAMRQELAAAKVGRRAACQRQHLDGPLA